MRNHIIGLFAILLSTISFSAYSQDTISVKARPKVGLVLSGGGAKGAAHIGVIKYLEEAINSADSDSETDAGYYFELAAFSFKNGNNAKAIESASKAIETSDTFDGKAYMLMGTIWGSVVCPGNEIEQRAKYWVATDYMQKAKNADASLTADCNNYISQYKVYYPQTAEAFMYDITNGQSYTVSCGGMRAVTTVRTQN